MIYSINFTDMARQINPLAFSKYLKETGWKQFNTKKNTVKVFQYECGNEFYQVKIPLESAFSDYNYAMYSAVEKVAAVECRSVEQVMLYLLNPNTDILKIRLEKKDVEAGNILFDDAIKIYDNAKKLLAATALDIINPKLYHYGRVDDAVQKFLGDCRFGQTEIGSYVVSVVCPFAELSENEGYKQLSIFSDEDTCAKSLTRKVTNKLMSNIFVIKEKIDDDSYNSLIDEQNHFNISGNFYEALNGLNCEEDDTILEFKAQWSPTVKQNRCEHSNVKLTNNYCQPISSIIAKMKEKTDKVTSIVGRVSKLQAAPIADNRKTGKISIAYIDRDNKSKSVTTILDKCDYDKAIEAHQLGKYVRASGNMRQSGRAVLECENFSIIE